MKSFILKKAEAECGDIYTINPGTPEGRDWQTSEFKASLIYRTSTRLARTTQEEPVSKVQKA